MLTMAVDDRASPAPSKNAAFRLMPNAYNSAPSTSEVHSTCKLPNPNTTLRSASILGNENSSPKENSRNTTPSSARSGRFGLSLIQSSAVGPTNRPTHK